MKPIIFLLAVLLSTVANAASESNRLQQLQAATQACKAKGFKTVGELDDCVHAAREKINSNVPERGTLYAEKNYKGLSKTQAEGKLISLKREYDSAPKGTYFQASKRAGAVDRLSIMNEGWWIQTHILGARQTQGDPWFMECKEGAKTLNIVRRCPLGKGGAK
ncbi:hypothetical protein N032_28005 (plasmid) [Pseudomonas syringae pv. pisi str. PP1]|uniref:hypothetical protein n=1 Tax=Pseudomonas syringae TaxID=317 RepID=UPI00046523E7|nr:hypothetical protein [Pseudomonas syringae]AZG89398.1 hypothetical protein N032_28005 [Pseudomonas syringae pv. pisi str. PP1]